MAKNKKKMAKQVLINDLPNRPVYSTTIGEAHHKVEHLISANKRTSAKHILLQIIEQSPTDTLAPVQLLKLYISIGDLVEAESFANKALILYPRSSEVLNLVAAFFRNMGYIEKSTQVLEEGIKVAKDKSVIYRALGFTYIDMMCQPTGGGCVLIREIPLKTSLNHCNTRLLQNN